MKTLDLTRQEIKNIIKLNNIPNNNGTFGLCCNYDEHVALKFDVSLLNEKQEEIDLSNSHLSMINVSQIDKLARLGDKVKLTTLPFGVAYCENVPVAVMMKYFNYHRSLASLPCELKDDLFKVLFAINEVIDELCQNYIYQLDIREQNFLYSKRDYKAEAIDLDGILIDISNFENIRLEEMIYERLMNMFISIIHEKMIVAGLSKGEISEKIKEIKSYYFGINNYYGSKALLRSIQKNNVLKKIK